MNLRTVEDGIQRAIIHLHIQLPDICFYGICRWIGDQKVFIKKLKRQLL